MSFFSSFCYDIVTSSWFFTDVKLVHWKALLFIFNLIFNVSVFNSFLIFLNKFRCTQGCIRVLQMWKLRSRVLKSILMFLKSALSSHFRSKFSNLVTWNAVFHEIENRVALLSECHINVSHIAKVHWMNLHFAIFQLKNIVKWKYNISKKL